MLCSMMTKILFSVLCLFSKMAALWSVKKEVNSGTSGLQFFFSILSWIPLDNSCQGPQVPKSNAVVNSQFSLPLNSQKHLAQLVTTSFLKYFLPLASRAPYYPTFPVASEHTPPSPPLSLFLLSVLSWLSSPSWPTSNGECQGLIKGPCPFFAYTQSLVI